MKRYGALLLLLSGLMLLLASPARAGGTTYFGNPGNYRALLDQLVAGDTLQLEAGDYLSGLPIDEMHGTAAAPIIIRGPASGPRARFLARSCCNTVSFGDASYIRIFNLELDGQGLANVDAVKAESTGAFTHDIWLENLYIHDHDANQQTVGISTKAPAWNWTIRRNIIDSAGTGLYLGDSNGDAPFVNGLIEGNLIVDTIGYNMQVKHQNPRPNLPGMPTTGRTIIRHNVFSKANNASTGGDARPNLLVGHWPLSGNGQNDVYEIYGNFFYQNPTPEALFQGEGNVALYNNLFVATTGDAIAIQAHNDVPREVRVFLNT
ncbi:MAG: right-handed parallel beta-helix repeat-containing protein, partial [Anaerolineales bacterium]|nr:right-handed parallel beta-helix repeat-containing protein [Anaerolineales bacterium]